MKSKAKWLELPGADNELAEYFSRVLETQQRLVNRPNPDGKFRAKGPEVFHKTKTYDIIPSLVVPFFCGCKVPVKSAGMDTLREISKFRVYGGIVPHADCVRSRWMCPILFLCGLYPIQYRYPNKVNVDQIIKACAVVCWSCLSHKRDYLNDFDPHVPNISPATNAVNFKRVKICVDSNDDLASYRCPIASILRWVGGHSSLRYRKHDFDLWPAFNGYCNDGNVGQRLITWQKMDFPLIQELKAETEPTKRSFEAIIANPLISTGHNIVGDRLGFARNVGGGSNVFSYPWITVSKGDLWHEF